MQLWLSKFGEFIFDSFFNPEEQKIVFKIFYMYRFYYFYLFICKLCISSLSAFLEHQLDLKIFFTSLTLTIKHILGNGEAITKKSSPEIGQWNSLRKLRECYNHRYVVSLRPFLPRVVPRVLGVFQGRCKGRNQNPWAMELLMCTFMNRLALCML